MHLADTFIQSYLHCIILYIILNPQPCVVNAMILPLNYRYFFAVETTGQLNHSLKMLHQGSIFPSTLRTSIQPPHPHKDNGRAVKNIN